MTIKLKQRHVMQMALILFWIHGLHRPAITMPASHADPIMLGKISGRVVDSDTGEPLFYANVFIANTTKGTATDKDGRYILENIYPGRYELVISMMGYETQMMPIRILPNETLTIDIRMRSKPIETPSIEVTAERPKRWRKDLKRFIKLYLGESPNASRCRITNPEVLDFSQNEVLNIFTASASAPLIIENRALGFRIETILVDFSEQEDGTIRYIHKPRFEDLEPRNEKEQNRWRENRLKTYRASLQHFLQSLAANRLEEQGYIVHTVPSMEESDQLSQQKSVTADTLLSPCELNYEHSLNFDGFLRVLNWNTGALSLLKMNALSVTINTTGMLYDPYGLIVYGYWSQQRVADELPLDIQQGM